MKSNSTSCLLCGEPASAENTDHGNRLYIACTNPLCGDYEISRRAAQAIANSPGAKEVLRETARRANQSDKILDIAIGPNGQLQAVALSHA